MTCICERVDLGDGEARIEWPAAECPEHGRPPRADWRAGDPLRRHMRVVDLRSGEVMTRQEAHERLRVERASVYPDREWTVTWQSRFRDETPREVEARLLREVRR